MLWAALFWAMAPVRAAGGIVSATDPDIILALEHTEYDVHVAAGLAEVTVIQWFENPALSERARIEAGRSHDTHRPSK